MCVETKEKILCSNYVLTFLISSSHVLGALSQGKQFLNDFINLDAN